MIVLGPSTAKSERDAIMAATSSYLDFVRRCISRHGVTESGTGLATSAWDVQRAASRLVVDFDELLQLALALPGRLAFRPSPLPHAYFNACKVDARNLP